MSKSRTAKRMQNATGMTYRQSYQSELDSRSYPRVAVPDPHSRSQAHFEALVAHTLADELRDRQLGAVFGVTGVDLRAQTPILILQPTMASRAISLLLPHYDGDYGGIRGIPGARPVLAAGRLLIHDLLGEGSIELAMADGTLPPRPSARPDMRADWRRRTPTTDEVEERSWQESKRNPSPGKDAVEAALDARDLIFSRLLRRPRIVNRVAGGHGHVNSYTHGSDLVFEWCCGVSHREMRDLLDQSGLIHRVTGITPWQYIGDDPERGTVAIDRHGGSHREPLLTLRSGQICPTEAADVRRERMSSWYR